MTSRIPIVRNRITKAFTKGTYNLLNNEVIPVDAAQASSNWVTKDGHIELGYGREFFGGQGVGGKNEGLFAGFRHDGTKVFFKKSATKIQYYNAASDTWLDSVTGLTNGLDYSFTSFTSPAGNFVFAIGQDGIFKISTANPSSFQNMYDATKNFLGSAAFVDKGRMILWGVQKNKTGLYGSHIFDPGNYQLVSAELVGTGDGTSTVFNHTLAFKSGNPTATAFGLSITESPSGITATDDYNGVIAGTGVTGTINYVTGVMTLTFAAPVANGTQILIDYEYDDTNNGGVTDFTYGSPRLAGEGFVEPQDEGGDAIQNVLIGQDGAYYSLKVTSAYRFELDATDLAPTNIVYRRDIGIPSAHAAVSTGSGIVFMNTANPTKPMLTILLRNSIGDAIEPNPILAQYDFSQYDFSDCFMATYDRFTVILCKTNGNTVNDTILLCNIKDGTVDAIPFGGRFFMRDGAGGLYTGDTITDSVWKLFEGFTDNGDSLSNFWYGNGDLLGADNLKKVKYLYLRGLIQSAQSLQVYLSYDDASPNLIGTILGNGTYVDTSNPETIGSSMIGEIEVGGGFSASDITASPYFIPIKLVKTGKFRKRALYLKATGIGYVSCFYLEDHDYQFFEQRPPKKYRIKQHASLDGTETNQPYHQ